MSKYKLVVFDLDGTLAESKQPIRHEMSQLLTRLLADIPVAVISGGAFEQLHDQVAKRLPHDANVENLYVLPTSGAALYEYRNNSWHKVYEEHLSHEEAQKIEDVMRHVATDTGIIDFSQPAYGERIEYRGSQVSMSALGQHAPLAEKKAWDPDHSKRRTLQEHIAARLHGFSVGMGGATTIDVTKEGIDKAYGVHKLCERLGIQESESVYVGDELVKGGNDEAAFKTDAQIQAVKDPSETAAFIQRLIS
jgi:phosphomannomutase